MLANLCFLLLFENLVGSLLYVTLKTVYILKHVLTSLISEEKKT